MISSQIRQVFASSDRFELVGCLRLPSFRPQKKLLGWQRSVVLDRENLLNLTLMSQQIRLFPNLDSRLLIILITHQCQGYHIPSLFQIYSCLDS